MKKEEALAYIHRADWRGSKLGLERIRKLLCRLGSPHEKLKYVHAAGTNGKGSVCAMLSSVLSSAGYRTGLYSSPVIHKINEYMQVNGCPILDDVFCRVTAAVKKAADTMAEQDQPTVFELLTAIAFVYFFEEKCEIVVLEAGMGGRLDSTNSIPLPELALITPVSFDHMKELGDTLSAIAAEKAGIIKQNGKVISACQEPCVMRVLEKTCRERNAELIPAETRSIIVLKNDLDGQIFSYKTHSGLKMPLLGSHQRQNAALAITAAEQLIKQGWNIKEKDIRAGLASVRLPARFEVLNKAPWFILDGGHNAQCADTLTENLNTYFPGRKVSFLAGVLSDKDIVTIFKKIIPISKRIITIKSENPRALCALELARILISLGAENVLACGSVEAGLREILQAEEDIICAFGTFTFAGKIRTCFGKEDA